MKATIAIAALFASLAAASPTGNGNIPAYDPRDITPDGLWKRWCDGSPVPDPICPHGAFWFSGAVSNLREELGDIGTW
ncbi:hypothetical protein F5Y14DRAFT_447911 [Nemania sp. NC0429]|nr:hypothetical protein F5Y14DRAFT_447911 [Nemania sp. NC0429]